MSRTRLRYDPSRLQNLPGHLVRRCKQKADRLFEAVRSRYGLTSPQYAVLLTISSNPGLEQSEIAEASHFDAATTGGIVQRLENAGLVQRRASPRSRRGRTLYATRRGEAKLRSMEAAIARLQEDILAPLNVDERRQLLVLWRKMVGMEPNRSDGNGNERHG